MTLNLLNIFFKKLSFLRQTKQKKIHPNLTFRSCYIIEGMKLTLNLFDLEWPWIYEIFFSKIFPFGDEQNKKKFIQIWLSILVISLNEWNWPWIYLTLNDLEFMKFFFLKFSLSETNKTKKIHPNLTLRSCYIIEWVKLTLNWFDLEWPWISEVFF